MDGLVLGGDREGSWRCRGLPKKQSVEGEGGRAGIQREEQVIKALIYLILVLIKPEP